MLHFHNGAAGAIKTLFRNYGFEISRTNSFNEAMHGVNFRDYIINASKGDVVMRSFMKDAIDNIDESKSQNLQDMLVDFILAKRNGFFVEFGATDGVGLSNSNFLQYRRDWTGILAEPARQWHQALASNRPGAIIDRRCVWRESGELLLFREAQVGGLSTIDDFTNSDAHSESRTKSTTYEVDTISLNDLLAEHKAPALIDYLSIDTEGSEYDILSTFDFGRYRPAIITVEHNFTSQREKLHDLIVPHDYVRIFTSQSLFDDWYVTQEAWNAVLTRN